MAKCMLIINNHLSYNLTIGAIEAHRTAWSPRIRACWFEKYVRAIQILLLLLTESLNVEPMVHMYFYI